MEHSKFCLDLLENWQVHPEEQLLFYPEQKKAEGSFISFILQLGSGTNNVHSWSADYAQGLRLSLRKNLCWGSQQVEKFFKVFVSVHTLIYSYLNTSWMVFPCVSVCEISQCIQLHLLMENFPEEKSPRFRVQVQISLWWCRLFGEASEGWEDWGGAGVQE